MKKFPVECSEIIRNALINIAHLVRPLDDKIKVEILLYMRKITEAIKMCRKEVVIMGWSDVFKYFGIAMEAATLAASVHAEIATAKDPSSPGGKKITDQEKATILANLDDEMSSALTMILEEVGLPVKKVTINIELE